MCIRDSLQALQRQPRMHQIQLALGRQAQAARRARQQAHLQLLLQTLECGAGHGRRDIQQPRRGGQAAGFGGTHEELQVVETQHGGSLSK